MPNQKRTERRTAPFAGSQRNERHPFTDSDRLHARVGKPEDKATSLVLVTGIGLMVFAGLIYLAVYAC